MRETTRSELERGALCAGDLARAASWEVGQARRHAEATTACEHAASALAQASRDTCAARAAVATAKADAEVVERLRLRAVRAYEAREAAKLEEAAEDAFNARSQRDRHER